MLASQEDTNEEYIFKLPSFKAAKSSGPVGKDRKESPALTHKESPYFQKKALSPQYSSIGKLDIFGAKPKVGLFKDAISDQMPPINYKLLSERGKATSIANLEQQFGSLGRDGVFLSHRSIEIDSNPKQVNNSAKADLALKKGTNTLQSNFENFVSRFSQLHNSSTLPNPEPLQYSSKSNGIIKAYGACTNQGLVRSYNEDRITTMVNIMKPMNKYFTEKWPNCSIFAIFDGHGGARCADFLKDNLHHYIVKSPYFPDQPAEALKEACQEADKDFLEIALAVATDSTSGKHDRSGSCGLVMLTINNDCYICNIGDSRAVLSKNLGTVKLGLTRDHKPCDELEKKRIYEAGGKIYQSVPATNNVKRVNEATPAPLNLPIPFRISPGRLAISRAFGDIEAKMPKFGGNPNVLICCPEVTSFTVSEDYDFVILGCDGIYDVMSNEELIDAVWNSINKKRSQNIHEAMKIAAEDVVRQALLKKSLDNVTVLIICFSNLDFKSAPSNLIRKPVEPKEAKLPLTWEYYSQGNERVTTPRKLHPRPIKQILKGKSHPTPGEEVAFTFEESPKVQPVTPRKQIIATQTDYERLDQNKKRVENEWLSSKGLPRISKIRTPR